MAATFSQLLLATLVPATRQASEETLKLFENSNFPEYLKALAMELCDANAAKDPRSIRLAGVILKNCFDDSRSNSARLRKYKVWNALEEPFRALIRECVLRALVSPIEEGRKSAAQVVAALGVLEFSERRWPELVPVLLSNVTASNLSDDVKVHTLEAMGFLCENENLLPEWVDETKTNQLLTAIVESMKPEKAEKLRVAASKALLNTLVFAKTNMERENERNVIATKICECAQSPNQDIRGIAFDCMAIFVDNYYYLLNEAYMQAFFSLTFNAIKGDHEDVVFRALEFWCALCEAEAEYDLDFEEAQHNGELNPVNKSKGFIRIYLKPLVDLITLHCLKRQDEVMNAEEEDWNVATSGATLLGLIAGCVRNDILELVMPFVSQNIMAQGPQEWRSREAGLMAFGKVLEGPSTEALDVYIKQGMSIFLPLLDPSKESHPLVRNTAAWVIGVVLEVHLSTIGGEFLPRVVQSVLSGLDDPVPRVAVRHVEAIMNLAKSLQTSANSATSVLSVYVPHLLKKLVQTTERADWDVASLRAEAFEAINSVVEASPMDCVQYVIELLDLTVNKLGRALQVKIENSAQKEEVEGMVNYCIATLVVMCQRLGTDIQSRSADIMMLVQRVMEIHNSSAIIEAFMLVGGLAKAMGSGFLVYFELVSPYILRGLRHSEDYMVCQMAAELVSDVSLSAGELMLVIAPDVVKISLDNLANPELNRAVKPKTISALGDLAMALNEKFEPFAVPVTTVLEQAAQHVAAPTNSDDQDLVDYVNELRASILEAYTAILHGLGRRAGQLLTGQKLDSVLNLLVSIARDLESADSYVSADVVRASTGLLGDLCVQLGQPARYKVGQARHVFEIIIHQCFSFDDDELMQSTAEYARTKVFSS